ncbi:chemotaxis protein CheX [Nocardioides sp. J9]|uniref:chemotaxis protein CheX n=1 Tax=unclassified Nocardioides TaxID=2615069 RepID=UPI0004B96F7D|nr:MULTISPECIES: chemotaxis protein CheX [unclassified Nocardioides]TWG98631.1 chemotaxis protein CheX [Nocardioides sp. J9]
MTAPTTVPGYDASVPSLDDVGAVTDDVWLALVGEDEVLLPRPVPPGSPFDATGAWSAAVTVTGEWQGVVTVELDEQVARLLSARMLALPEDGPVNDGDVADAVGELVNMVGGNVKSLMPGPSVLSLPSVAAGRAAFASDVVEVCRLDVAWRGGPVRVCVHVPRP